MRSLLHRISHTVNRATEITGCVLMCVLVVVIAAEVFARYVLNSSLSWSEEFGRILFVWVIFLGTSIGFKNGAHMGLHFITEMAPLRIKRVISKLSLLFCSIFFLFIFIEGLGVTLQMASQLTPAMEISLAWQLSPIPLSALIMLVHVPMLFIDSKEVSEVHGLDTPA